MYKEVTLPPAGGLDVEDAKADIRSFARSRRAERRTHDNEESAHAFARTCVDFALRARDVACYVSIKDEPSTKYVLDALVEAGHRVLLPKLGPRLARQWAWYEGKDDLSVQAPGRPPEPSGTPQDCDVLTSIDVMIIPALIMTTHGERLGQGGGWYDRILKDIPTHTRVGAMVFEEEFVDEPIPQEDTDVKIPYVILPDRWIELENVTR